MANYSKIRIVQYFQSLNDTQLGLLEETWDQIVTEAEDKKDRDFYQVIEWGH